MVTNHLQKKAIRARMEQTGEPYNVARRHLETSERPSFTEVIDDFLYSRTIKGEPVTEWLYALGSNNQPLLWDWEEAGRAGFSLLDGDDESAEILRSLAVQITWNSDPEDVEFWVVNNHSRSELSSFITLPHFTNFVDIYDVADRQYALHSIDEMLSMLRCELTLRRRGVGGKTQLFFIFANNDPLIMRDIEQNSERLGILRDIVGDGPRYGIRTVMYGHRQALLPKAMMESIPVTEIAKENAALKFPLIDLAPYLSRIR